MEIYQSDERPSERARLRSHALAHRLDEFPVGYSLASCSPAALASASPAEDDSQGEEILGEGKSIER